MRLKVPWSLVHLRRERPVLGVNLVLLRVYMCIFGVWVGVVETVGAWVVAGRMVF